MSNNEDVRLLETPLASVHRALGAKMIDFAGWHMPVQYTGIVSEHQAVRSSVGLFDLSHMGELWLSGADALANLQRMTTNDASKLEPGMAQYTFLTNPSGGIVDDLIVYCTAPMEYLLVVNAANTRKDVLWIEQHLSGEVTLEDRSPQTALIAIQGPNAADLVQAMTSVDIASIKSFRFVQTHVAGVEVLLARTGYTGEDGFECLMDADKAVGFWEEVMHKGRNFGLVPVGLGARDTLRLEASLPLYGNELSDETTPYEAGLGFFVKLDKGDFIGRAALEEQKEQGVHRRLVGFVMEERGIPRQGYSICDEAGHVIGEVTSGTHAPSIGRDIGMGYVVTDHAHEDQAIWIQVRSRAVRARVVRGRLLQLRNAT